MYPTLPPNAPQEPSEMMDLSIGQPSMPSQYDMQPTIMSKDNTISTWNDVEAKMKEDYSSLQQCLDHFKTIKGEERTADEKMRTIILGTHHMRSYQTTVEAGRTLSQTKAFDNEPQPLRESIDSISTQMDVLTNEWKNVTEQYNRNWMDKLWKRAKKGIDSIEAQMIDEGEFDTLDPNFDKRLYESQKQELRQSKYELKDKHKVIESKIACYLDYRKVRGPVDHVDNLVDGRVEEWEKINKDWDKNKRFDMDDLADALEEADMDLS